jgi:hypothetical protein
VVDDAAAESALVPEIAAQKVAVAGEQLEPLAQKVMSRSVCVSAFELAGSADYDRARSGLPCCVSGMLSIKAINCTSRLSHRCENFSIRQWCKRRCSEAMSRQELLNVIVHPLPIFMFGYPVIPAERVDLYELVPC